MPGEPAGMPGTEMPAMSGRSEMSLSIAANGTCPATTYPSISAVWQAQRSAGMPAACFMPA